MMGCRNGLVNQPPCRTLIGAMVDMGWSIERRAAWVEDYKLLGDAPRPRTPSEPTRENIPEELTATMIDITGVDLRAFVKEAYALSRPAGLGLLHYVPGPLSDADTDAIIARGTDRIAASMDYVRGRACKMTVFRHGDKLEIKDQWFDHSPRDLAELLGRCGVSAQGTEARQGEDPSSGLHAKHESPVGEADAP